MALAVHLTAKAERDKHAPVLLNATRRVKDGPDFSSQIPGGFAQCRFGIALPQSRAIEIYERYGFMGVLITDGGSSMWEGRISSCRLTDYGVMLDCEGYWSNMSDQTLYSWWADNSLSKWRVPVQGGFDYELSLAQTNAHKFITQLGEGQAVFSTRSSTTYAVGDRSMVYYKLPDLSLLTDRRVFDPATIHAVQFRYSRPGGLVAVNQKIKVYTADRALGTWTLRYTVDPVTYSSGASFMLDLVPAADAYEGITGAIAIGLETETGGSGYSEADVFTISNVVIFADRNAPGAGRPTAGKIIKNLLLGNAPLVSEPHAMQLASDTHFIENSDLEIIPSVFDMKTFAEIAADVAAPGIVEVANWIPTPSAEENTAAGLGYWRDENSVPLSTLSNSSIEGSRVWTTTVANAANDGMIIVNNKDTSQMIPVRYPGESYTFSVGLMLAAGGAKNLDVRLRWYSSAGVDLGSVGTNTHSVSTTPGRYSVIDAAPAGAFFVRPEIQTTTAQGVFTFYADAARLVVGFGNGEDLYVDGDTPGYMWAGMKDISITTKTHPAVMGVFGERRLHFRKHSEEGLKWIIPMKTMLRGGAELERDVKDTWTRIWGSYTELFTNERRFTDVVLSELGKNINADERDLIRDQNNSTQTFTHNVIRAFLDSAQFPREKAEITIKGRVLNAYGGTEPVWRVRAGDYILIPDITPLSMLSIRQANLPPSMRDSLKVFLVREADYSGESGELRIVPDNYLDNLALMLARVTTTPLVSTIPAVI